MTSFASPHGVFLGSSNTVRSASVTGTTPNCHLHFNWLQTGPPFWLLASVKVTLRSVDQILICWVINDCGFSHFVGLESWIDISHDLCRSVVSVGHVLCAQYFYFLSLCKWCKISHSISLLGELKEKLYDNQYHRLGRGRDSITDAL